MASSWTVRWGWFLAGALTGACLLLAIVFHYSVALDLTLGLGDLLDIALALFLAMYIPFVIERQRSKHDQSREMVIGQVRGIVDLLSQVNESLKEQAGSSNPDVNKLKNVRTAFMTANLKIGRLERRVRERCGEACTEWMSFRAAYDAYFTAVTGGSYYGNGVVSWEMWKQQEAPFVSLDDSAVNLALRLHDS